MQSDNENIPMLDDPLAEVNTQDDNLQLWWRNTDGMTVDDLLEECKQELNSRGMIKIKHSKTENVLDEIDWGNGRKFKCNSYWNDNTSFVLDVGDGELVDKDGNLYFIHCEYNCNNGMWHYVFEIWFENDSCSIYDIPKSSRSEYLSETEIEELRGIIYNLCKDKINL